MNDTSISPRNSVGTSDREIERFFGADQDQVARFTAAMRRVEELGERLLGTSPAEARADAKGAPAAAGSFGTLVDFHSHRNAVLDRIEGALTRIEGVF